MHLWLLAASISTVTFLLVLFVFGYLTSDAHRRERQKKMKTLFLPMVSEIILCENEAELEKSFDCREVRSFIFRFARNETDRINLAQQLVSISKGISGVATKNIVWLYRKLNLQKNAMQRFQSSHWHIKAAAIQELAAMEQKEYLPKIYKATNDRNFHVRMEAQLTVIKWTGWPGLRFLNVIQYPITPWQQLSILQELPDDCVVSMEKLRSWLFSENETVVEIALKLIHKYQCFELEKEVVTCSQSASYWVKREAVAILQEHNEFNLKQVG